MAKVMISIPDEDLARIDAEAERRRTSRSELLREAALAQIAQRDPARLRTELEGVRTRLRHYDARVDDAVARDKAERDDRDRAAVR